MLGMASMSARNTNSNIIGIGAPIIDYILEIEESYLENIPGAKGGMVPIEYSLLAKILKDYKKDPPTFLGGSASNTIRSLAWLGEHCGFVGKIGVDVAGQRIQKGLAACGVDTTYLFSTQTPTSQVLCLITPDKERTLRSFLGASRELLPQELTPQMFRGVKLVHFEGYMLLNKPVADRALELAREAGAIISFDLGSFEIVEMFKETIFDYLKNYVDIVFGNSAEIYSLTKLDPERGGEALRDLCNIVVVLMGKKGCYVAQGKHSFYHSASPVIELPIDTTGAGDLFASGFLHGYLKGLPLLNCARFGALAGAAIVQVQGVELSQSEWKNLRGMMSAER